jgi:hypothetical protein
LTWSHRTLEQHIAEVTKRTPLNLLFKPTAKRHQKAIDPETGRTLGYARWNLPPSHVTNADGTAVWPEAVVPAVEPEEAAEIERIADTAIWDPNDALDEPEEQLRKIKNDILARKPYMRM